MCHAKKSPMAAVQRKYQGHGSIIANTRLASRKINEEETAGVTTATQFQPKMDATGRDACKNGRNVK
jgi:hypothetical protein